MSETPEQPTRTDHAADPGTGSPRGEVRSRRSWKRRLAYLLIVLVAIEGGGWVVDYVFNYRQRLLAALAMMRVDSKPIPALSDTSHDRELVIRDPRDGPGAAEPYRIGGVTIGGGGPWLAQSNILPEDVVRGDEQRVFVIGGSAAYGFPYRYADTFAGMLSQSQKRSSLRVLNASEVGWTSGELAPVVDQAVGFYDPAAIVLMVGNNEWFHWQPPTSKTHDEASAAPAPQPWGQGSIATLRVLAHSRALATLEYGFVQWMLARQRERRDASRRSTQRDAFEHHHELVGSGYAVDMPSDPNQFTAADWLPVQQEYLATYRDNLRQMVARAQAQDVRVVLMTLPYNPRLSPAWKHRQPHWFIAEHREAVSAAVIAARRAVEERRFEDGLRETVGAILLDPHPAILHYLQAECLEGLERHDEAERSYAESRERMVGNLGSRLSTNRIVREVATETGATLLDVQELFAEYGRQRGRHYLVDLIHDDCHPTPLGHQLIAERLAPLLQRLTDPARDLGTETRP